MRKSVLLLSVPLLSGCITVSTFQTPEPLDPGEVALGAGFTFDVAAADEGDEGTTLLGGLGVQVSVFPGDDGG